MKSIKDKAIKNVVAEFEKLSNLLLSQLDSLNDYFETDNSDLSNQILLKIKETEILVNKFEVNLDNQIIKTVVLYKPVASDLRQIFAIYRMTINLERVGDLVIKIANYILKINDFEFYKNSANLLRKMLELATENLRLSLLSFFNADKELAIKAIKNDKDIDILNKKLLNQAMKKNGLEKEMRMLILNLSDIRTIVSAIERIGDQASNIAESSIYATIGAIVRHQDI